MSEKRASFENDDNFEGFKSGVNVGETEKLKTSSNVAEIWGTIKWFDIAKGYGFIIPTQAGLADVLIHVTCLRRDGFHIALEGAQIHCLAKPAERGLQAFHVISMDNSKAVYPAVATSAKTHNSVTPISGLERALVKWFNRTKGFGFLTCGEGTEDIFVHMEIMRRYGLTELRPGQVVFVRYGTSERGLMASEIHPDVGSPVSVMN